MHNNANYQCKICWNKALTFGVGSIQLSFRIYHCVHPIHANMFSIQMLLHFSQIVPRVCTLVLSLKVVTVTCLRVLVFLVLVVGPLPTPRDRFRLDMTAASRYTWFCYTYVVRAINGRGTNARVLPTYNIPTVSLLEKLTNRVLFRCGHGTVAVRSRYGHGTLAVWSRFGRGAVEACSQCGRGMLAVQSRRD